MNNFKIKVPFGYLFIEEKGSENDYPGVMISFDANGNENEAILVAIIEHDSIKNVLQTVSYKRETDEPYDIVEF